MSDKKDTERGRRLVHQPAEVEGQGIKGKFEPEQDVEGQGFRWSKNDSEAPENTDLSDAEAAQESEVEGQGVRPRIGPESDLEGHAAKAELRQDVEGQGFRMGATDSEAPESTDVTDAADSAEVEGQVVKPRIAPERKMEDR